MTPIPCIPPGSIVDLPKGMTPANVVVINGRPDTEVEEALKHYYNRDPDALTQLIRRLVIHKSQQP